MKKYIFAFIGITLTMASCRDVFEKDISKSKVRINTPTDSLHTSISSQIFWWDKLDGSENYQIQIVRGDFSAISAFIVDSVIPDNHFAYILTPGSYQWRIRAYNAGYSTSFFYQSLTIDSTLDLANQSILLLSPLNNTVTNAASLTFSWVSLYNVTDYRIQLMNASDSTIINDVQQTSNNYTYNIPNEGYYLWRVRGQNTLSVTPYSYRSFEIDRTAPIAPYNLSTSTSNNILVAGIDSLKWEHDLSSVSDSLFIYPDSLVSAPFTVSGNINFYVPVSVSASGHYYFRLKSTDIAGNTSTFSVLKKYSIQ